MMQFRCFHDVNMVWDRRTISHTHKSMHKQQILPLTARFHLSRLHAHWTTQPRQPLPRKDVFTGCEPQICNKKGGETPTFGGVPSWRDFVFFPDTLTVQTHLHTLTKTHTTSHQNTTGTTTRRGLQGWDWSSSGVVSYKGLFFFLRAREGCSRGKRERENT